MNAKIFLGVVTATAALAMNSRSQDYSYVWTGGEPGFSGEITLDASSSAPGGGTVSDIVSAWVIIPEPEGDFRFSYTPGSLISPQAEFYSQGPLTWNSQEITAMAIYWVPRAPTSDNLHLGPGLVEDYNANGFTPARNTPDPIEDVTGSWQAATAVPEPGTGWLVLLGLGALAGWHQWLRRPSPRPALFCFRR